MRNAARKADADLTAPIDDAVALAGFALSGTQPEIADSQPGQTRGQLWPINHAKPDAKGKRLSQGRCRSRIPAPFGE